MRGFRPICTHEQPEYTGDYMENGCTAHELAALYARFDTPEKCHEGIDVIVTSYSIYNHTFGIDYPDEHAKMHLFMDRWFYIRKKRGPDVPAFPDGTCKVPDIHTGIYVSNWRFADERDNLQDREIHVAD